ncbi:hypothetical protein O3P69_010407 [Scylla paramamosain]|uniref:Uncharacterized protein n=1 Tax=Scylla paramamosain TaxID=85552 RepID=A0AAW0TWW1_SCYPA
MWLLLVVAGVASVAGQLKPEDGVKARNALLLIYQKVDALCPCVTRDACPDYYGSSALDVKKYGNLPPCILFNRVRCCRDVSGALAGGNAGVADANGDNFEGGVFGGAGTLGGGQGDGGLPESEISEGSNSETAGSEGGNGSRSGTSAGTTTLGSGASEGEVSPGSVATGGSSLEAVLGSLESGGGSETEDRGPGGSFHFHPLIQLGYLPPSPDTITTTTNPPPLQHYSLPQRQQEHFFHVTPSSSQHVHVITPGKAHHRWETQPLRYGQKLPLLNRQGEVAPKQRGQQLFSVLLGQDSVPSITSQTSTLHPTSQDSAPPHTSQDPASTDGLATTQSHSTEGQNHLFKHRLSSPMFGTENQPSDSLGFPRSPASHSQDSPPHSTATMSDLVNHSTAVHHFQTSLPSSTLSSSHPEDSYTLILQVFPSSAHMDQLVSSSSPLSLIPGESPILTSVVPLSSAGDSTVPSVIESLVHLARLPLSNEAINRGDEFVADLPCVPMTQCYRHYGNRSLDDCAYGIQPECGEEEIRCLDQYVGAINVKCFKAMPLSEALPDEEQSTPISVPALTTTESEHLISVKSKVNMTSNSSASNTNSASLIQCASITSCKRPYGSLADVQRYGILDLCPKDQIRCLDKNKPLNMENYSADSEGQGIALQPPSKDDDALEQMAAEHLDPIYEGASEFHPQVSYANPLQQVLLPPLKEKHSQKSSHLPLGQGAIHASRHAQAPPYPQQHQQSKNPTQNPYISSHNTHKQPSTQQVQQNISPALQVKDRVTLPNPVQSPSLYTNTGAIHNPSRWQTHASSHTTSSAADYWSGYPSHSHRTPSRPQYLPQRRFSLPQYGRYSVPHRF